MGYFYFDESIHAASGFILGAFVYSRKDPAPLIKEALIKNGFVPGEDEFKSRTIAGGRGNRTARLREDLGPILQECSIGVVVIPTGDRKSLGEDALNGLARILAHGSVSGQHHEVFFDEGIGPKRERMEILSAKIGIAGSCNLHVEQDSKTVMGLQLADLAAHMCAIMLKETLGDLNKTVKAGENSGYDPNLDVELGFELFSTLRYSFFCSKPKLDIKSIARSDIEDYMADVSPFGLYVSARCDPKLRDAATGRFGRMYLGCIH